MSLFRSWRVWALSLAAATVLIAVTTAQSFAGRRRDGITSPWQHLLLLQAFIWYAWAALAPAIIGVASRIRWQRGREGPLIVAWIGIGIGFATCHAFIEALFAWTIETVLSRNLRVTGPTISLGRVFSGRVAETLASGLLVVSVVALSFYAIDHYRLSRAREERQLALEAHVARARLDVLRSQLQPHFLFNTLHTVSALLGHDVPAARRVLTRLGDLLRASLDTASQQEVPLRDELAFLGTYLDIQQMRFGDRLRVRLDIDADVHGALVPSMLLQPLVENWVRHAVEPSADGSSLTVQSRRVRDTLMIEVADDGPGIRGDDRARGGIGLSNTRERLAHLYGTAHELRIDNDPRGGLRVCLTLPWRTVGA